MKRKIFIGVAWPYVNGDLHIGHLAGYLLPADICARFHKAIGNDVLMVSGSDCHGTPITLEADKKKTSPKEIVEYYHARDVELFQKILKLSYNIYTRTDNPIHAEVTQEMFIRLLNNGYVFVDSSLQFYSKTEKRFLPDRYVKGECPHCGFKDSRSDQCDNCGKLIDSATLINPRSNISGDPVELRETQHYYVDWAKLQPKIQKFVEKEGPNWKNWVYQETLGWLNEGLKPRPVTRDIDWGVEIPKDRIPQELQIENIENKRFYVWFDAVIGYFSASVLWAKESGDSYEDFWFNSEAKHYYFMGKDNLPFHTLFWPGKLISYDENINLPNLPSINSFLNLNGQQFSKSRGVTIDSRKFVEDYGNDRVRFYLTLIMPEIKDSNFVWEDFKEKNNGVLVATIGNFIHRVLSISKNVDSKQFENFELSKSTSEAINFAFENSIKYLENCEFRNYLDEIIKLSSYGNHYVDSTKIWELDKNSNEFKNAVGNLVTVIIALAYLFKPLLFEASEKLFELLNLQDSITWPKDDFANHFSKALKGVEISKNLKPLFEKIEEVPQN